MVAPPSRSQWEGTGGGSDDFTEFYRVFVVVVVVVVVVGWAAEFQESYCGWL